VERLCRLDGESCMNAAFLRENRNPPLAVPETFLLYFDRDRMREIMGRYGVGTRPVHWHELGADVRERLATLGIAEDRLPESHKPYFDTLRLLMMLASADGHPYRFSARIPASPGPSDLAFHVGGVSDPRSVQGIWALRGSYFWRRALECAQDSGLRAHYEARFGAQSSRSLLEEHTELAREISPEFFALCERVLGDAPAGAG
jgi:hypothetical protein